MKKEEDVVFTHQDYRKAKIVHLVNQKQEVMFYYRGKMIAKEEADAITETYMKNKKNKQGRSITDVLGREEAII